MAPKVRQKWTQQFLEAFAKQYMLHPVLWQKHTYVNKSDPSLYTKERCRAYHEMAKELGLPNVPKCMYSYCSIFHKVYIHKLPPHWWQKMVREYDTLPIALQRAVSGGAATAARGYEGALRLQLELLRRLRALSLRRPRRPLAALLAHLARQLGHGAKDVARLWELMRNISMHKLRVVSAGGDRAEPGAVERLTALDWRVVDLALYHGDGGGDDDHANIILTETRERLRPMLQLFHLVQTFQLEAEGPDAPARWTAATRAYCQSGMDMSRVTLQRRWHELKLLAARRMAEYCARRRRRRRRARKPLRRPHRLYIAIANRYPQVVTEPLPSWRSLVDSGAIYLGSDEEEAAEAGPRPAGDVACVSGGDADNAFIELENDMETVLSHCRDANMEDPNMEDPNMDDVDVQEDDEQMEANCSTVIEVMEQMDPTRVQATVLYDSDTDSDLCDFEPSANDNVCTPDAGVGVTASDHSGSALEVEINEGSVSNDEMLSECGIKKGSDSLEGVNIFEKEDTSTSANGTLNSDTGDNMKIEICENVLSRREKQDEILKSQLKVDANAIESNMVNAEATTTVPSEIINVKIENNATVDVDVSDAGAWSGVEEVKREKETQVREGVEKGSTGGGTTSSTDGKTTAELRVSIVKLDHIAVWKERSQNNSIDLSAIDLQELCLYTNGKKFSMSESSDRKLPVSQYCGDASPRERSLLKELAESPAEVVVKNENLLSTCKPGAVVLRRLSSDVASEEHREDLGTGRVVKKIELPDIEEVRRINRGLLTAEVRPTGGGAAAPGRPRTPDPPTEASSGGSRARRARGARGAPATVVLPALLTLPTRDELAHVLRLLGSEGGGGGGGGAGGAADAWALRYCCAARRHVSVNAARRRLAARSGRHVVDLCIHGAGGPGGCAGGAGGGAGGGAACGCCCRHLLDVPAARRSLHRRELTAVQHAAAMLAAAGAGPHEDHHAPDDRLEPKQTEPATPALDEPITPALDERTTPALDESTTPALDEPTTPALDEPTTWTNKPTRKRNRKKKKNKSKKKRKTREELIEETNDLDEYEIWIRERNLASSVYGIRPRPSAAKSPLPTNDLTERDASNVSELPDANPDRRPELPATDTDTPGTATNVDLLSETCQTNEKQTKIVNVRPATNVAVHPATDVNVSPVTNNFEPTAANIEVRPSTAEEHKLANEQQRAPVSRFIVVENLKRVSGDQVVYAAKRPKIQTASNSYTLTEILETQLNATEKEMPALAPLKVPTEQRSVKPVTPDPPHEANAGMRSKVSDWENTIKIHSVQSLNETVADERSGPANESCTPVITQVTSLSSRLTACGAPVTPETHNKTGRFVLYDSSGSDGSDSSDGGRAAVVRCVVGDGAVRAAAAGAGGAAVRTGAGGAVWAAAVRAGGAAVRAAAAGAGGAVRAAAGAAAAGASGAGGTVRTAAAGAGVRVSEWVRGRDPTALRVLRVDPRRAAWRLARGHLVLTDAYLPADHPLYCTLEPTCRRLALPDPEPSAPEARQARPHHHQHQHQHEDEDEDEDTRRIQLDSDSCKVTVLAPKLVYVNDETFLKLQNQPLLYAKVLSVVPSVNMFRHLVGRRRTVYVYSPRAGRVLPLVRSVSDDDVLTVTGLDRCPQREAHDLRLSMQDLVQQLNGLNKKTSNSHDLVITVDSSDEEHS